MILASHNAGTEHVGFSSTRQPFIAYTKGGWGGGKGHALDTEERQQTTTTTATTTRVEEKLFKNRYRIFLLYPQPKQRKGILAHPFYYLGTFPSFPPLLRLNLYFRSGVTKKAPPPRLPTTVYAPSFLLRCVPPGDTIEVLVAFFVLVTNIF